MDTSFLTQLILQKIPRVGQDFSASAQCIASKEIKCN